MGLTDDGQATVRIDLYVKRVGSDQLLWRVGRVVECTSPLTRQAIRLRGFESLTLRTAAADCRTRIGLESDREPIYT